MLQRSCNIIKTVSLPSARPAGCYHRQLHSLMRDLVRSRCALHCEKYKNLHKQCFSQRRGFIWSIWFSHDKNKNSSFELSSKTAEKYNLGVPFWKPLNQSLSKSSGSGIFDPCSESDAVSKPDDKNTVKAAETSAHNGKKKTTDDERSSSDIVQKAEGNANEEQKLGQQEGNKSNGSEDDPTCELRRKANNESKLEINVAYGATVATDANAAVSAPTESASTITRPEDQNQNEGGKTENDNNVQKGKSSNILLEKAKNLLKKSQSESGVKADMGLKDTVAIPPPPRRRKSVDLNKCSTERNFITPVRAMTDFLLKPSDLEGLRKTKRRSPYENDPPITVYWRKDVEAKAIDVWGSKENLLKEILKRDIERRRYQQNIFTVKRRLRDYRREQGRETEYGTEQNGLFSPTGRVIMTAVCINWGNFMFKLGAWLYTGSPSMFSEAVHSLADTINQMILAFGILKSGQKADSDHPYGYTNMRYVASLISGVAIFCLGCGVSFYHGVTGLTDPSPVESYYWAFLILAGSFASEGATLLIALNSVRNGAKAAQTTITEYVLRGTEPSVNVVLLEDTAAVLGIILAAASMELSILFDNHIPDAIGSLLVGGLLAVVATFIIFTNVAALVGRSIPQDRLDKINAELESDVMIRAIHDVKGIDMGNSLVRYKAELDFDGGELTRSYLDKQDLNQMLEEVKKFQGAEELEAFMLKHGENIVDMLGGEIDRIELKLRKKHPEIRHCDLEIL